MSPRKILFLLSLALAVTACSSTFELKTKGEAGKVKEMKKIALLEVLLSPPDSPSAPLIDAAIYKGIHQDIFGEIAILHEKSCDSIVNYIGGLLTEYSHTNVLYGKSLFEKFSVFDLDKAGIKTYSLALNNDNYPKLCLPPYALNFFDLSNKDMTLNIFGKSLLTTLKPQIQKLCGYLGVEGIAFAAVGVNTVSVGGFGTLGDRVLITEFHFFDKTGERVYSGKLTSHSSNGRAADFEHYVSSFNKYNYYCNAFLRNLYLGESPRPREDE